MRMHLIIRRARVPHAHGRVDKHALCARGRVVGVDEAALGGLEVVGGERVVEAAEAEALDACEC